MLSPILHNQLLPGSRAWWLWPKGMTLCCYTPKGRFLWESRLRDFDLADSLMLPWPRHTRTVVLGLKLPVDGSRRLWTESLVQAYEERIRYDLSFDAYSVRFTRLSPPRSPLCTEHRWKLSIKAKGF